MKQNHERTRKKDKFNKNTEFDIVDEENHKRLAQVAQAASNFQMDLSASGKGAFDLGFQPSGIFPGLGNGVFPQANMFGNYHQEWEIEMIQNHMS